MTRLPVRTSVTPADHGGPQPHRRGMRPRPPARLLATIRDWVARRRRRSLTALSELDDHLLKDIGVSRQEAVRECAKWFWQQ